MRSSSRPTAMKTSGAPRISARSASGPLPPSLVNSTSRPNARSIARRPAATAGESIGEKAGRTPGPNGVTTASIPDGVAAATYPRRAAGGPAVPGRGQPLLFPERQPIDQLALGAGQRRYLVVEAGQRHPPAG